MRTLDKKQISVLLTVIALLLWSHGILYARFEIGYFGLTYGLPVTFFIALALLAVASAILWVSRESHGRLLCLQLLVLISALWLVPVITGGSPPFDDHAYRSLAFVDYIAGQGSFSPSEIGYLSWPGAFILSTTLAEVFSVNFESTLHLFPFFMQLLYLLPLYVFLKNTLGQTRSNYCWAGAWLFYVASWAGNAYFSSAPGVGLFLFLTLLALFTMPSIWEGGYKSFVLLLLVVVVFTASVTTHLLTALAALCIITILTVVKKSKRMAPVVALCLLLLVSWNLTGMERQTILTAFTSDVIMPGETLEVPGETLEVPGETLEVPPGPAMVEGRAIVLAPDVLIKTQFITHLSGSESHIAVGKTRILFSAVFAMIGIIGTVAAFLTKRNRSMTISILAMTLAPLVLIFLPYGGRLVNHLYIFLLAPMAYFGAQLLDVRKWVVPILCLILVVAFPFHLIAHYGNQAFDYFPQSQVSGLRFSYDRINSPQAISSSYPWATLQAAEYPFIEVTGLQWQGDVALPKEGFDGDSPRWLYIHRQHEAFYNFMRGDPLFIAKVEEALSNTVNGSLIYYNPDFELYYLEPAVAR